MLMPIPTTRGADGRQCSTMAGNAWQSHGMPRCAMPWHVMPMPCHAMQWLDIAGLGRQPAALGSNADTQKMGRVSMRTRPTNIDPTMPKGLHRSDLERIVLDLSFSLCNSWVFICYDDNSTCMIKLKWLCVTSDVTTFYALNQRRQFLKSFYM